MAMCAIRTQSEMHRFLTPAEETTYSKLRIIDGEAEGCTLSASERGGYESCCRIAASLASVSRQRSCHQTTMNRKTQYESELNTISSPRRNSIDDDQANDQEGER